MSVKQLRSYIQYTLEDCFDLKFSGWFWEFLCFFSESGCRCVRVDAGRRRSHPNSIAGRLAGPDVFRNGRPETVFSMVLLDLKHRGWSQHFSTIKSHRYYRGTHLRPTPILKASWLRGIQPETVSRNSVFRLRGHVPRNHKGHIGWRVSIPVEAPNGCFQLRDSPASGLVCAIARETQAEADERLRKACALAAFSGRVRWLCLWLAGEDWVIQSYCVLCVHLYWSPQVAEK